MRKIVVINAILLMLFLGTLVSARENFDFRQTYWEMSIDDVRLSEGENKLINSTEDSLAYKTTVASLDANIGYIFYNDKLICAGYLFDDNEYYDYIDDYNYLKELLIKKYGDPEYDEIVWSNDYYRNEPEKYFIAIKFGHLIYFSMWNTETTQITLSLMGENFEVKHNLIYQSLKYLDLENQTSEEDDLSGL